MLDVDELGRAQTIVDDMFLVTEGLIRAQGFEARGADD